MFVKYMDAANCKPLFYTGGGGVEDSYQTIFSDYLSPAASAMLGFTARNPHKFDAFFNLEIREFLFSAGGALAEDLIALNIHRGRDHGMSGKIKNVI